VRFKLDENMPAAAATPFEAAGHHVDTVLDEGLAGGSDAPVLAAAGEAGRVVVTLDRGFGDIRAYPPGTYGGIVVIRPGEQSPTGVREGGRGGGSPGWCGCPRGRRGRLFGL
jgi:predicted nuclease of predicted toxin-antitoxin system